MKFHNLYVSSVSACFELENTSPYYAEDAFDVTVNGAPALKGVRTNVFSLFDLCPGTEYCVAIGEDQLIITTKEESGCIDVRSFGAVGDGAAEETQPRIDFPPYRSSLLRHPTKDPHHVDPETIELWSPAFGHQDVHALESDLTIQHNGEPMGERIIVRGRILDGDGHPVRNQLVEIWQANSAGRYIRYNNLSSYV